MTVDEYIVKVDLALKEFTDGQWFRDLIYDIRAEQSKRIFVYGVGGKGKIGKYSTNPMLATKEQFVVKTKFKQSLAASGVSFSSSVKSKKTKSKREKSLDKKLWITFTNRKTGKKNRKGVPVMVIDGGYKEFRQIQGREDSFVNMNYTGDLFRDFSTTLYKVDSGWATGVKRKINMDKIGWMSEKYGKETFMVDKKTKDFFNKRIAIKAKELFNDLKR